MLAAPSGAAAQSGAMYRIGYLGGASATTGARAVEAFRQGLHQLGWIEGRNLVIDYRFAEGRWDRLPELAAEIIRLRPDVIVAGPTPAAVAMKRATPTIPIVMWGVGDPIGLQLIASIARPAGNVTGVSFSVGADTVSKGLELLKEAVPKARCVAVLSNPANPSSLAARELKRAGQSVDVQLVFLEARQPGDFDRAFAAMAKAGAAALVVVTDSVFYFHRARLVELTTKSRLPSMHQVAEYVEAGALMSYGASVPYFLETAATFVDRILKGAKPADLPVEQPTKFELVINLTTAKALGLTVPPSLLLRADQVIE